MQLAYHSEEITQDHFAAWVEWLYNIPVREWYDHSRTKEQNLIRFEQLLSTKSDDEQLVVLLDMFHLPERENKYNQNPFPHYVIIELTDDPDLWHLYDPDYRWRGDLPRETILNAMAQPTVAGGYTLHRGHAQAPQPADLAAYFAETFRADDNLLTSALRQIFDYHCDPARPLALADLGRALREMPVLSLRKYAYEHAFAFFWQELDTAFEPFDAECDRVEALCEGFRSLHFLAARIAHTGDRALIPDLFAAAGGAGMKISLCTISFRHQLIGLKDIACWAHDNGFKGIELWAIHARNQSPLAIHNAQWMAAQGLSVPMISDYLPLHDPDLLRSRILLPRIAHYHLKNVSGRDRLGVFAPSNVYSAASTRDGMVPLCEGL
ncbi:DUF6005 family protein [Leisingera sp. NJS204]|uniref:DUF6005 family protein n=1 Tax=Leisingera sp. NJS204 TaxID=2508307 RepID=UPI0020C780CB|nr:DUF6005 family protein [Leisingera sp. NJS204]